MRRSVTTLLCALWIAQPAAAQDGDGGGLPPPVFGDASPAETDSSDDDAPGDATGLAAYYRAMAERRLLARETGSATELRDMIRRGEDLYLDDRFEEAQRLLYEAVESPRFTDFAELDEYREAELLLAGTMHRMGALRTAWRYLERILERGTEDPYFGPAYRRAVDVALEGASLTRSIEQLEAAVPEDHLTADTSNELLYLRGMERYDAHDWEGSIRFFEQVGRRSRFYANARYLQGVIAARAGRFEDAEAEFCSIATTPDTDSYTFMVDRRYFEIRDLTWLALGRVAHESRRPEDAFYYYFQVPQDSERVAEALFEAAWAMYEGDDHDTAVDLLDQLEVRFPDSPFVHEASLLRGYVHLARCEFEEADELFTAFQTRFTPVVHEIDRILENPARQDRVFEELLATAERTAETPEPAEGEAPGEGGAAPIDVHALLLSLLRVDPGFYRMYREIRTLDAEAARAGRVSDQLGALIGRLAGSDAPRAADAEIEEIDEVTALRRDLEGARAVLRALSEQLGAMRGEGASAAQIDPLESELAGLAQRVQEMQNRLDEVAAQSPADASAPGGPGLEAMLREDRANASRFDARVADVRHRMVEAANETALRSLRDLRDRMGGFLRRSRIGRIDAVMGSKRRIEIQIESLAAGRFPPELMNPLSIQGLLRDDEEYWPFEGEYWADEFQEDAADAEELDDEGEAAEEAALDEEADEESDDAGDEG